jgi:AraC-like DNA-binding protein
MLPLLRLKGATAMERLVLVLKDNPSVSSLIEFESDSCKADSYLILHMEVLPLTNVYFSSALLLLTPQEEGKTSTEALNGARRHPQYPNPAQIDADGAPRLIDTRDGLPVQCYFLTQLKPDRDKNKARNNRKKASENAYTITSGRITDARVKKAIVFINKNHTNRISCRDVAKHVCLSRNHFAELFKRETGSTVTGFLNYVRITRAGKLIREHPEETFSAIAEEVGFSDVYYFSRIFKRITGRSPRRFRKSCHIHHRSGEAEE